MFSKRKKYFILLMLIMLNVIIRIPAFPHEIGVDSFKIHAYANLISSDGFANWILHPLSVFGSYPFSIPSAVPFLQSGLSQSTAINMEHIILITSIVIGIIGTFTSYIMAKEIKNDDFFAVLVAFCFSISPLFLSITMWTTSSRNLFVALVPFFIWALLKCNNDSQYRLKYSTIIFFTFILLGTIHHMVLLLVPVLIVYFVALIFNYIKVKYYIFYNKIGALAIAAPFIFLAVYMLFVILQIFKLSIYDDFNIWYKYQSGVFFTGIDAQTLIGNMIVDYASKIGILSIFVIPGLIIYFRKQKNNLYRNFSLMVLLSFAPIITMGWYVPYILLSFFCVLLVCGILNLNNIKQVQQFFPRLILICIISSTFFSMFMLWNWGILIPTEESNYLHDSTENMGLFLKDFHTIDASFVSNVIERQISSVSELPYPPPDTAYIFNLIDESDLGINPSFSLSDLANLDESDVIYKISINYREEYRGQSNDVDSDSRRQYNKKYNIKYVIQNNLILGRTYSGRIDTFYSSVYEKKPKIYDNNELSIWYL